MGINTISFGGKTYERTSSGPSYLPWSKRNSTIRLGSLDEAIKQNQTDVTLNFNDGSSLQIPSATLTNAENRGKLTEAIKTLISSNPTTGPAQQKIDEALGKIHGIIGGHPHLGTEFSEEIYEALHPESAKTAAETQQIGEAETALAELKSTGLVREDGTIDLTKLKGLTSLDLKKANLSVNIKVENGVFEMTFNGNCGEETAKVLKTLKEVVNKKFEEKGLKDPITLNPNDVLLGDDAAVLERCGQIQIKTFPNGKTLKLILDPGQNGQDDGLTIKTNGRKPVKIPLSAVFGGEPYQGVQVKKDGHPILEDYQKRELFLKARPHTEEERILPFTSRFANIKDNKQEAEAASNELWAAVWAYLRATVSPEEQEAQPASKQLKVEQTAQKEEVAETPVNVATEVKDDMVEKAILEPGNESKLETAKIVAKAGKLPKKPLRTKNLIDAGKQVVDAVKRLEESLRLQNPSSDSEKPLSPTPQLAEDVLEVAEVVAPKAQAVEINTQAINPTVIKDLSQALSSLRRRLEELPDGPDDIYKAFEELKNNLKELQGNVPELFSNQLFLKKARENNPELFEKILPNLAQLQQVTASILANIKDHATSDPNDELSEIFEQVKSVNGAINQLLVKPKLTPYEESDDILNAAKDLVAGGLKDLSATLNASNTSPNPLSTPPHSKVIGPESAIGNSEFDKALEAITKTSATVIGPSPLTRGEAVVEKLRG